MVRIGTPSTGRSSSTNSTRTMLMRGQVAIAETFAFAPTMRSVSLSTPVSEPNLPQTARQTPVPGLSRAASATGSREPQRPQSARPRGGGWGRHRSGRRTEQPVRASTSLGFETGNKYFEKQTTAKEAMGGVTPPPTTRTPVSGRGAAQYQDSSDHHVRFAWEKEEAIQRCGAAAAPITDAEGGGRLYTEQAVDEVVCQAVSKVTAIFQERLRRQHDAFATQLRTFQARLADEWSLGLETLRGGNSSNESNSGRSPSPRKAQAMAANVELHRDWMAKLFDRILRKHRAVIDDQEKEISTWDSKVLSLEASIGEAKSRMSTRGSELMRSAEAVELDRRLRDDMDEVFFSIDQLIEIMDVQGIVARERPSPLSQQTSSQGSSPDGSLPRQPSPSTARSRRGSLFHELCMHEVAAQTDVTGTMPANVQLVSDGGLGFRLRKQPHVTFEVNEEAVPQRRGASPSASPVQSPVVLDPALPTPVVPLGAVQTATISTMTDREWLSTQANQVSSEVQTDAYQWELHKIEGARKSTMMTINTRQTSVISATNTSYRPQSSFRVTKLQQLQQQLDSQPQAIAVASGSASTPVRQQSITIQASKSTSAAAAAAAQDRSTTDEDRRTSSASPPPAPTGQVQQQRTTQWLQSVRRGSIDSTASSRSETVSVSSSLFPSKFQAFKHGQATESARRKRRKNAEVQVQLGYDVYEKIAFSQEELQSASNALLKLLAVLKAGANNLVLFVDGFKAELTCGFCFLRLKNPQAMIPCGHTFCRDCIEHNMLDPEGFFTCAECKGMCREGYISNETAQTLVARWDFRRASAMDGRAILNDVMVLLQEMRAADTVVHRILRDEPLFTPLGDIFGQPDDDDEPKNQEETESGNPLHTVVPEMVED